MPVPFIDLRRFEPGFLDRWAEKCAFISANTQFVGGPEAAALERRLAEATGAAAVVGCANGTDALQLALRAAGVGPGDRVVIPDSTFWATFEAVVNVGARAVTVDVDPTDLQMDFELFRQAVETHRPKAAILVHLYGWGSARLEEYRRFCAEQGVALIEDGAQCYGVTLHGVSLYRDAYLSTCSFYPAKVLGSCGDAGCLFAADPGVADTLRKLGDHGRTGHYEHGLIGWNSRLGGFDAAWLNLCLDYVEERLASRRRAAAWYQERLPQMGVQTVTPPAGYQENGYLNVCLFQPGRRDEIQAALKTAGIGTGVIYPLPISAQPAVRGHLEAQIGGENAARLCRSVLSLPLFAHIREEEQEEVLSALRSVMG